MAVALLLAFSGQARSSSIRATTLSCAPRRSSPVAHWTGRRHACRLAAAGLFLPAASHAADEYKDLSTKASSKLLNSAESGDALAAINWAAPKATGLSIEEMARRVDAGLRRECWFVTGRSLPELFSSAFTFSDPQVTLAGIEEYSRGVRSFYKQGFDLAPYLVTTTLKTSASDGGLIVRQEDAFEAPDKVELLKYNLFKARRPAVPDIGAVACPLPRAA